MGRLIDADKIIFHEIDEIGGEYEPYLGCRKSQIDHLPTVEAIPKSDYENRLKADMIAMLSKLKYDLYQELCKEIHGKEDCPCTNQTTSCLATFRVCDADSAINRTIQEKINALKENKKWNG